MIDPATGSVVFDSGERVHRGLTRDAFLRSALARGAKPTTLATARDAWFSLEPQRIGATAVCVWLSFRGPELQSVQLALQAVPPGRDYFGGVAAAHDEWLAQRLGTPPYVYPWGRVDSQYDSKEVEAWISISYTTAPPAPGVHASPLEAPASAWSSKLSVRQQLVLVLVAVLLSVILVYFEVPAPRGFHWLR